MLPATPGAPFIDRLHAALARVHPGAALPSPAVLAEATNLAYRLSTQLYEGKPVRSSLHLVRDRRVPIAAGVSLQQVDASHSQLRALCAAFPEGVVLAPSADGRRCEVHAALPLAGLGRLPSVVELRFQCPGLVSVLAKGSLVGTTRAGEAPTVFDPPRDLAGLLKAGAVPSPAGPREEPGGGQPSADSGDLLALLRAMHAAGAGGTLVLCPAEAELSSYGASTEPLSGAQGAPWTYAGDQALHLRHPDAIEEMIGSTFAGTGILRSPEARAHWAQEIRQNTEALLGAALAAVGRLARADGAVFLRRDLALLGFGLRLAAKERPRTKVRAVDAQGAEVTPPTGGTRLRGALDFIAAHPQCVAFVLSADGPLRMVTAASGTVTVQLELEAFL